MSSGCVVLITAPRGRVARGLSQKLVAARLAACVNLVPGLRSLYRWQGAIQDEREVMALMKTRKQDWTALLSRLHELHPYETPECIAVRVAAGAPKYMEWLEAALQHRADGDGVEVVARARPGLAHPV